MKLAIALAAAMGLALAPAAAAQASCSQVEFVIKAAVDDFESIVDDETDEEGVYETTYWLPRAGDCFLDLYEDSIYSCSYAFSTQQEANVAFDNQAATLAACLGAAWPTDALPSQTEFTNQSRRIRGTVYAGSGDREDMGWSLSLEEFAEGGSSTYKVWIEMIYLL